MVCAQQFSIKSDEVCSQNTRGQRGCYIDSALSTAIVVTKRMISGDFWSTCHTPLSTETGVFARENLSVDKNPSLGVININ